MQMLFLGLFQGDLNKLSNPNEKLSANKESSSRYANFNKFIDTNGLIDVGHLGVPFTWSRKVANSIFAI